MRSSQALLLSVFVVAVAGPASAQARSSSSAASAPAVAAPAAVAGPAEAWTANAVGKYRITLTIPEHDMTADVTVREESGRLIANIWPVGDHDGRDFDAAVKGNQLVITGPTEHGALNLTIEHRTSHISGTWSLGEQKGPLSGDVAK